MSQVQVTIECGYCLRKGEELPTPKILPCNHIHCMQCLCGFFEENHTIVCPVQGCGEIVEGLPDTLPSYDMVVEDNTTSCDVCMEMNMDKQEAVIYCTVCSSKFCEKHLMSHDETKGSHEKISIEDNKPPAKKTPTRNCPKHEDQTYSMGCKLCLNFVCKKCLPDLDMCDNGVSHSLLSLADLVATLMKEDISAEMLAKEDQYEKLFKKASKAKADHDNKTAEMVELIREIRDDETHGPKPKYEKLEDGECKQLKEDKYKKLKQEAMENRQKSSVAIAEFMEDIVLRKWTQLGNHRKMLESRVKCSHQVDVVKGWKELKEEIQKLVEEKLPKLQLTDQIQLHKLDISGAVALEVVSSYDIVIDAELPQFMELLKSVQIPTCPLSACHHSGSTYVGLWNGTITRIDNNYQLHNSFISTRSPVSSIVVYKDKFYTLYKSFDTWVVGVYDMSGGLITNWTHPHDIYFSNMLTVVADQIVVADPTSQRITVYSLTGESLRHIPCPLLSKFINNMCAVDNTSVAISVRQTSTVFRVNITTGEVMWTLSDLEDPQGLVCYGSYILLAAGNNTIYILDTTTGSVVSELADDAITGKVYSMEVYGTTLVVPLRDDFTVFFYQLSTR